VVRTRVGYAGGTSPGPTYRSMGDHSETIQIDYNPEQISYEELLEIFWDSHNPTIPPWSRQYASIIFYHDDEQKRLATETRDRETARQGKSIHTEIVPFSRFYMAEGYHQKYRLRQEPDLMEELQGIYGDEGDLVNSTVAARLNGYIGGNGTSETLQSELDQLGLSDLGFNRLLEMASACEGP
jgi:peptide-methionine (S)-S-oxide reductase